MKYLNTFFLLFFLLTALHAGYIEVKDGKTIIHVKCARLPDPAKSDTKNRADFAVVKSFIAEYPRILKKRYLKKYSENPAKYGDYDWNNVEIQLDRATGISVKGVESDLLMIAGGIAPDVLYVNFRKSDTYIRNNFLYPLDKYFAQLSPAEKAARVHEKIWPVIRRKNEQGVEHIWAIPYGGMLGKVLLYRKDIFDDNNIAYPDNHWTWDDMYAAAKKITDPGKGIYGIGLSAGKHESWSWLSFLWSAGGDVMVYNKEKNQWKCVFDSDGAAKALDFYVRLSAEKWRDAEGRVRRGYAYKDSRDLDNRWERGLIGMYQNYIDEELFSKIDPDVTGMVPIPLGPAGLRGGELNSRMFGLFSGIKSEVIRDAAWEYMRYYGSEEAIKIRTRIMVEGGLGRFVNPKYLKKFGYPEIIKLSPPGWSELFSISIASGKPEPYGRNSNVAYDLMTMPIQKAEDMMLRGEFPEDEAARLKMMKKLLEKACARANEIMIGRIPEKEMFWRRAGAWIMLTVIALVFFLGFRSIFKVFTPPKTDGGTGKGWDFKKYLWAYMLLIPAVATIFVWSYIPLGRGSVMAFYDYRLIGESVFVGVDNFANLLVDMDWWQSVYNALRYSLMVLGFTFLPPIILAILLQEVPRGKLLFRIIYYLPAVITGLVTILLWKQFYDKSDAGVLNMIILKIPAIGFIAAGLLFLFICMMFARRLQIYSLYWQGALFLLAGVLIFLAVSSLANPILFPRHEALYDSVNLFWRRLFTCNPEPYRWLQDRGMAMVSCVIPMIWAGMGPGCLIYLAALKGIPDDYYEAADIDGATFADKILFVVFPTLKALIIINFVGAFIASWYSATGNILAMTGGGANTEVAGLHIWYRAFTYLQFGPATSMAWLLGFILIGFTVHQLRILSKVEFKTTGKK